MLFTLHAKDRAVAAIQAIHDIPKMTALSIDKVIALSNLKSPVDRIIEQNRLPNLVESNLKKPGGATSFIKDTG
jgi:hypothetical protein